MTLIQFLFIALFGMAVFMTIACLVIIRQHRNKEGKVIKFDDSENFYDEKYFD